MAGVLRTRVGYAGGTYNNPTYHDMGDHTEVVLVEYNPAQISYADLLQVFVQEHDVYAPVWSRQYMSLIVAADDEQEAEARAFLQEESRNSGRQVATTVLQGRFWQAEDYHQKYYMKLHPLVKRYFAQAYSTQDAITNSLAAARVNGYLGGFGMPQDWDEHKHALDLPDEVVSLVQSAVDARFQRQYAHVL